MNKYKNIIENFYNNYDEDIRFTKRKSNGLEYATNKTYIKKYIKPKNKILEIGAGTGAYSLWLAEQKYDVTAIELVQKNVDILKSKITDKMKIKAMQGDALNLPFEDNSFDVVLSLGPMYHLFGDKDRKRAIKEAVRVCKPNGIVMFAYLTHSGCIWKDVAGKSIEGLIGSLDKFGRVKDDCKNIFSFMYVDEFKELVKTFNMSSVIDVASDGIAFVMKDYIAELTDKQYKFLLDYHLKTCERKDTIGMSSHVLSIFKKVK